MKSKTILNKCSFSEEHIRYVKSNYKKLKISEIAKAIFKSNETVRVNMKLLGLVSPFCKKRTILPALTSKQKVFILSNYNKMTVTELKKALNIDYFIVWRFLKKNNLSAEKLSYKDKPQIIIPEEPVKKTSFERPPAVYSNTNYQQAYL